MTPAATLLNELIGELTLFAAVGFLIFALDDLLVDILYFARTGWRSMTVYNRYPRAFGEGFAAAKAPGRLVVFIPAWDEAPVIAPMLRATLERFEHGDYQLYVGHYRNDPGTAAAIASVDDPRIRPVLVEADGPTSKADCLNHLWKALKADEAGGEKRAKAIVLHDAEDLVHPFELKLFDRLVERAAVVQLPVLPLLDPNSRWIAGHYADEFAEAHIKQLVVREAVGAAIPLAGVGCAIERSAMERLSMRHSGKPFAAASMTEDYEMGLRLGALGYRTLFVRLPAAPGSHAVVASRGHFPAELGPAVRQKARWLRGIALAGWERLGWRGGLGERWFRMRDRRGPLAALVILAGYLALFLWLQLVIAEALGAPVAFTPSPLLAGLLKANLLLAIWRLAMRFAFTARAYGVVEGLRAIPRTVVGNLIAVLAARRALDFHARRDPRWEKTAHIFSTEPA